MPTAAGPVLAHTSAVRGERAIVLLHGAAGSWTTWLPVLDAADEPLPGAVALDLPGWGGSPDPVTPLDADSAAAAVVEVARALGVDRWTLAGHSLGGFVALQVAAREPEATGGMLLVSPTGPAIVDAIRRPLRGGARLPWFAGMLAAMRALDGLPHDGRDVLRMLGRLRALGPLARPLFRNGVPATSAAGFADGIRPAAFMGAARAAARADLRAWAAIACPVRSLRGARDVFAGAGDAPALARLIPDFAEEVLPDAGHFATAEAPGSVLAALLALHRA